MTNELVQKDGSYNPGYIDWLVRNLSYAALALCEILSYDPQDGKEGFLSVNGKVASEKIVDLQWLACRLKDESYTIEAALEYHNHYKGFVDGRGLSKDFERYVCNTITNNSKS